MPTAVPPVKSDKDNPADEPRLLALARAKRLALQDLLDAAARWQAAGAQAAAARLYQAWLEHNDAPLWHVAESFFLH